MGFLQIYKDAISEKQQDIIKLQKEMVAKDKEIDRLKKVAIELLVAIDLLKEKADSIIGLQRRKK